MSNLTLKFPYTGKKIIIESGHIYTDEQPSQEHEKGAKIGALLSKYLSTITDVKKWLFVDDYNPKFQDKPKILDIKEYIDKLSGLDFCPDVITYESDLVESCSDVLKYLQKYNYVFESNGKSILGKGRFSLYDQNLDKYTCPIMDACLYLDKLEKSDECITVLDSKYAEQQKQTLLILKRLGKDTSKIFQLYYNNASNNNMSIVEPILEIMDGVTKLNGAFV